MRPCPMSRSPRWTCIHPALCGPMARDRPRADVLPAQLRGQHHRDLRPAMTAGSASATPATTSRASGWCRRAWRARCPVSQDSWKCGSRRTGWPGVPMVWADYWVVDLDPDYQWAVVGGPSRKYLAGSCRGRRPWRDRSTTRSWPARRSAATRSTSWSCRWARWTEQRRRCCMPHHSIGCRPTSSMSRRNISASPVFGCPMSTLPPLPAMRVHLHLRDGALCWSARVRVRWSPGAG